MSDHANAVNDRVDMGLRVFLAGFFTPLALAVVVGVVGFGTTGSWLIALVAVASALLLLGAANVLYGGYRGTEPIVAAGAGVLLAVAIVVFRVGEGPVSSYIAFELLMPVIFAAVLVTPMVRAFVASRRGEVVKPVEPRVRAPLPPRTSAVPLLVAAAEGQPAVLSDQAKRSAGAYSGTLRLVSGLLLLCAVGGIALAVLSWLGVLGSVQLSVGGGLAVIVMSILAVPPALVLMVLADYWYFLSTTRGYDKAHLANIAESSQHLVFCVLGAIPVLLLLALVDFFAS